MNKSFTKPSEIDSGWKGTCCDKLYENGTALANEFQSYSNLLNSSFANDQKQRLHYKTKSFIVGKCVSLSNTKTVLHVGFGANERYPLCYDFFGIGFIGCELPENSLGSWFKNENFTNRRIIQKNFFDWSDEDFAIFNNVDMSSLAVVTEGTFYYLLIDSDEFDKRHILSHETKEKSKEKFINTVRLFRDRGVENFVFIEPENSVFEKMSSVCELDYYKICFSESYKYEFLLDYSKFKKENKYFPIVHILSTNKSLFNAFNTIVGSM